MEYNHTKFNGFVQYIFIIALDNMYFVWLEIPFEKK